MPVKYSSLNGHNCLCVFKVKIIFHEKEMFQLTTQSHNCFPTRQGLHVVSRLRIPFSIISHHTPFHIFKNMSKGQDLIKLIMPFYLCFNNSFWSNLHLFSQWVNGGEKLWIPMLFREKASTPAKAPMLWPISANVSTKKRTIIYKLMKTALVPEIFWGQSILRC